MRNMKVYIGTFAEEELDEMIKDIRRNGIRTEIKPNLSVDIEPIYYIDGKISELKEKYKETELEYVMDKWENYVNVVKSVTEDGMEIKEFERKILDSLFPERKEIPDLREIIKEKMEEIKKTEELKEIHKIVKDALKKMNRESVEKAIEQFEKEMKTFSDIMHFLKINGISLDDEKLHGKIPENPLLKIEIDASPEEVKELDLKYKLIIRVEKVVDLYVDFMDFIYETKEMEELIKKYPRLVKAVVVSDIAGMFVEKIEGKVDIKDFIEKNKFIKDEENEIMLTEDTIKEIISSLEREEIIKVKKDKIWLRKFE